MLDRGYVVVERYSKKEHIFAEFSALKYRFMASFGPDTEQIFAETFRTVNSIFSFARMLATFYWKRQGRVIMAPDEFQNHLEEMRKHEGIFWEGAAEDDEIQTQLGAIQEKLEKATAECFAEPMSLYSFLTKKLF